MKTLYDILALFFCAHQYKLVKEYEKEVPDETVGYATITRYTRLDFYRVNKCSKCGKETVTEV